MALRCYCQDLVHPIRPVYPGGGEVPKDPDRRAEKLLELRGRLTDVLPQAKQAAEQYEKGGRSHDCGRPGAYPAAQPGQRVDAKELEFHARRRRRTTGDDYRGGAEQAGRGDGARRLRCSPMQCCGLRSRCRWRRNPRCRRRRRQRSRKRRNRRTNTISPMPRPRDRMIGSAMRSSHCAARAGQGGIAAAEFLPARHDRLGPLTGKQLARLDRGSSCPLEIHRAGRVTRSRLAPPDGVPV